MHKNISLTLEEIATLINGTVVGNAAFKINSICSIDDPEKTSLSFIKEPAVTKNNLSNIGAVLVSDRIPTASLPSETNFILVKDPYGAFQSLIPHFFTLPTTKRGISDKADIDPSVKIGKDVSIGAFSVICENVEIGDGCTIHPHVIIYPHVKIGSHSILHAGAVIREECIIGEHTVIQNGAVIGADGFGFTPDAKLGLRAIPQVGIVTLGDRVEVGANSCIDRATFGTTSVGVGSKVDNLVQLGHNVKIGKTSIICAMVGIAGSSKIGNQVVLAGKVAIADHINVSDNIRVAGSATIMGDLVEPGDYGGFPAVPININRRNQVITRKIADIIKEIKAKLESKK